MTPCPCQKIVFFPFRQKIGSFRQKSVSFRQKIGCHFYFHFILHTTFIDNKHLVIGIIEGVVFWYRTMASNMLFIYDKIDVGSCSATRLLSPASFFWIDGWGRDWGVG